MKRIALIFAASVSFAAPIITIRPAIGPNDSSASFGGFVSNTISGLQTCTDANCSVGGSIATDPTAFNQTSVFSYTDMVRSSYSSWRGTAPPTGAFAGEFGNMAFWAVSIVDTEGTFSLHDLTVTQSSTDAFNYFSFSDTYASGPGSNYGFDRIGINFGADGVLGGGDDTIYQGDQDGGLPINALFFVGIGFGFDGSVDILGNPWPGPTDQDRLNQLNEQAGLLLGNNLVSTCYAIGATSSCASVTMAAAQTDPDPNDPSAVPEPASLLMMGAGIGLVCVGRRRRSAV